MCLPHGTDITDEYVFTDSISDDRTDDHHSNKNSAGKKVRWDAKRRDGK